MAHTAQVRVKPRHALYREGRAHHAGAVLSIPPAEAKSLLEQGTVERVKRQRKR